jgi:hypothetical protein
MQLIDGFRDEPHITSQMAADIMIGLVGPGDYALSVGNKFGAEYENYINGMITDGGHKMIVPDGGALIQGRRAIIAEGSAAEVIIENGSAGSTRSDLVVIRYTKDSATFIEDASVVVVKGTPNNGDPVINSGTVIRNGDLVHDMPLYRVNLNGIGIASIDRLFNLLPQVGLSGGVKSENLAANAVETAKIKDGAVTAAKLAANAVTSEKLGSGSVTAVKIATDSISTLKIQDEAVTSAKLREFAVTSTKIHPDAVMNSHVNANAEIEATKLVASLTAPNVPLLFPQLPSVIAKTNIQTLLQSVRDCLAWIRSKMYPHLIKKDTVVLMEDPDIFDYGTITIPAHSYVSLYHGIPSINHLYAASFYLDGVARPVFVGGYNASKVHIYNAKDSAITIPAMPTLNVIYD